MTMNPVEFAMVSGLVVVNAAVNGTGLADPSIGGIIGSDILSRYRFTVDYPKRLISLE